MEQRSENEIIIRRYLLGFLPQEELEKVEYRLLSDGDYLAEVSLLEEELVDEYVCGLMSPEERQKFEYSFLSTPEGLEQVKFATSLKSCALNTASVTVIERGSENSKPMPLKRFSLLSYMQSRIAIPKYAAAAMLVLFLLLGAGVAFTIWRLQDQIDQLRARQSSSNLHDQALQDQLSDQQARNDELTVKLQSEQEQRSRLEQELGSLKNAKPDQTRITLAGILLTPGRARGSGDRERLTIGPSTARASFYLVLRRTDYNGYKVSLQNEEGREIWAADSLKAQASGHQKGLRFSLPIGLLPDGDYLLKLYGITNQGEYKEADNYYFRTVRK